MLQIWGPPTSINVQKVMWTVGELGLEYTRREAGGQDGGLDKQEFARLNPHRRIPVIDDDGTVVWESNAIVRYLAAKYGAGGLWPEDPAGRAIADEWMEWAATTLQRPVLIAFNGVMRTQPRRQNVKMIMNTVKRLQELYEVLDRHLEDRDFIAGDALTIGDIAAGATLYRYYNMDVPRPKNPNLEAWRDRLKEREAYREHCETSL
jgi:glutathione S-transferase